MQAEASADRIALDAELAPIVPPIGTILAFAGTSRPPSDPSGQTWLLCDGDDYDVNEYRLLFAVIGTIFGGNAVTRFKVPDLRGRAIVGVGNGPGLTPRSLAEKLGAEKHTLQSSELPDHVHRGTTAGGAGMFYRVVEPHNGGGALNSAANHVTGWHGGAFVDRNDDQFPAAHHVHSFQTTQSDGCLGAPHSIVQPGLALNYIIRAR